MPVMPTQESASMTPLEAKRPLPQLTQNAPSASDNLAVLQASSQKIAELQKNLPSANDPKLSAVPRPENENRIDLAVAFRLAGLDSPTINLAREVIWEAVARQRGAQALLLPNLNAGLNYHDHTGTLQSPQGIIRTLDEQAFYAGSGAGALGSNSVTYPGIRILCHLGDAIYEPLAARQRVEVRRSDAAATENQILLQVSTAYFDLVGAEVRLEVLQKGQLDAEEIVRRTAAFSKRGQGRSGDMHRAEARSELLRRQLEEAEGNVATASARLSGLLNLDPATRLRSPKGVVQPLTLIDPNENPESLIGWALSHRPEIRARLQAVTEARTRVRQEQIRPFLPTIGLGFSAGAFGGGSNLTANGITQNGGGVLVSPSLGSFAGRTDLDVFAVWTLRNAGAGNRSLVQSGEAIMGQAVADLESTTNDVRREVAEALADTQAAARQIDLALRQLALSEEGFQEEMTRIKEFVGRPLELIDSFRQLNDARQEIFRTVIAYNAAQYRLFVAIGFSPLQSPETGISCDQAVRFTPAAPCVPGRPSESRPPLR
jgi:outer membrane protein TolC